MKTIDIIRHYNGGALEYLEIKINKYDDAGRAYTYREYLDLYGIDGGALVYSNRDTKTRRATFRPARWAQRLHGNAPSGTYYGAFRLQLADGTRVSFPVYIGDEY